MYNHDLQPETHNEGSGEIQAPDASGKGMPQAAKGLDSPLATTPKPNNPRHPDLTAEEFAALSPDEQIAAQCGESKKLACYPHEIEKLRKMGVSEDCLGKYVTERSETNRRGRRALQAQKRDWLKQQHKR